MRNILIIIGFVLLGVYGGFLCRGSYRSAIEAKLVTEAKQQLSEIGQADVDVDCDHLFVTLKFEPKFALQEQKAIAGRINNSGSYLGLPNETKQPIEVPEPVPVVEVPVKVPEVVEPVVEVVTPEENIPDPEAIIAAFADDPEPVVEPEPVVMLHPEIFVYQNQANHIVLEGRVQSSAEKNHLIEKLEEVFSYNDVVDMITVASNVKSIPWQRPEELITNLIGLTEEGSISFSDNEITIAGKTYSHSVRSGLNDLATLVVGAEGVVNNRIKTVAPVVKPVRKNIPQGLPVAPVAQAVDTVAEVFERQAIYFRSGSKNLGGNDLTKIKTIADTLVGFDPTQKLIVGGYADQTGDAKANRRLSLERANAVREQLVKLGISNDRLIVEHFGEDTSNLSENDMWKSRRVELSIKK